MKSQEIIFSWALASTLILPAFIANAQRHCNAPGNSIRRDACLSLFHPAPVISLEKPYQAFPFGFDGRAEETKEIHYHADTIYSYSTTDGNLKESYTYDANQECLAVLVQKWQNTQWVNMFQTTFTYNANGNCLTEVLKEWQNNAWVNNKMTTNTYDPNGNNLRSKDQEWQNNAWVNVSLTTQVFDGSGNITSSIHSEWVSNAWEFHSKSSYTYNTGGDPVQMLYQVWQPSAWVNLLLLNFTYDGSGNNVTQVAQVWQSNSWINMLMISMTYDSSGNMLTQLQQVWQNNVWQNSTLITCTYDASGNCLIELLQEFQGSAWENYILTSFAYDSNSNLLSRIVQEFVNNAWVNWSRLEYLYQPGKITGNSYEWDGVMWSPIDALLEVTYMGDDLGGGHDAYCVEVIYSEIICQEENATASASVMVLYPNPATGRVSLSVNASLQDNLTLTLFDLSGRIIRVLFEGKADQAENLTFDAGDLPQGMYVVEVKSTLWCDRQKLIIE